MLEEPNECRARDSGAASKGPFQAHTSFKNFSIDMNCHFAVARMSNLA